MHAIPQDQLDNRRPNNQPTTQRTGRVQRDSEKVDKAMTQSQGGSMSKRLSYFVTSLSSRAISKTRDSVYVYVVCSYSRNVPSSASLCLYLTCSKNSGLLAKTNQRSHIRRNGHIGRETIQRNAEMHRGKKRVRQNHFCGPQLCCSRGF